MEIRSLMRQAALYYRANTAVVAGSDSWSFEQAWRRGIRLANGLRELGVKPGDRVAGLEDNTVDAVDLFLACAIAGAVRVPLYARNSREGHAHMLDHTETGVLLVDDAYGASVAGLEGEIPTLRRIMVRDESYCQWRDSQSALDPDPLIGDDDWFIIRHSGGTTGKPKGVAYTHHDWLVCCRNWFYRLPRLTPNSAVGHAGAVSHASGYMFLPAWLHGSQNILFSAFDPDVVVAAMQEHRISHMFLAPTMLASLARHPESAGADFSALEALLIGSAPITDATALAGRKVFGDKLYQAYGQTEALPVSVMTPEEWFGDIEGSSPMRSAGRIYPFADVQIWDEQGSPLPLGAAGEIVVKVEAQMHGYWQDEALTKERLVNGWVRTGDIGRIDHNGFLYVSDRADDLIISGGFNIWPAELETVIADHPAVLEVAVFGIPHEKWGETPIACCVTEPSASVTAAEIIELCSSRLGNYKRPSRVEFRLDPLPRSPVGKVQRKLMREPYWRGHDRRVSGS